MPPTFIANRVPYGAHVILLFILAFAALVLVILVTFSSPFISSINFLYLPSETGSTTFGAFGWCAPDYCLKSQVAYEYGTQVNRALTGAMMLWAISIIFTVFLVLSILPLLFVHESKALRFVGNRSFFAFTGIVSSIVVTVAWLLTIYGWSIAHRAFELSGGPVKLGSAIWMGLAATLCVLILYYLLNWPRDAWDGAAVKAGGQARGLPAPGGNGYYHYKRTTREVVPRY